MKPLAPLSFRDGPTNYNNDLHEAISMVQTCVSSGYLFRAIMHENFILRLEMGMREPSRESLAERCLEKPALLRFRAALAIKGCYVSGRGRKEARKENVIASVCTVVQSYTLSVLPAGV